MIRVAGIGASLAERLIADEDRRSIRGMGKIYFIHRISMRNFFIRATRIQLVEEPNNSYSITEIILSLRHDYLIQRLRCIFHVMHFLRKFSEHSRPSLDQNLSWPCRIYIYIYSHDRYRSIERFTWRNKEIFNASLEMFKIGVVVARKNKEKAAAVSSLPRKSGKNSPRHPYETDASS